MLSPAQISVIIPVYKVENYLNRCVQSALDQSYPNVEIILVDDGSPDSCPSLCDAWAEKDSRVLTIHKANGGLSDARNVGMAAAHGEFITFLDGDDWIAPEMLERLLLAMKQDDSDIAACAIEMFYEDRSPNQRLTVCRRMVLEREAAQRALLEETLLKQPACSKLYRTETIRHLLFPVGKYHEDVFWSYQAVGNARRVSLIDYVGYYYRQHASSIMGAGYSLKRLDAVEAADCRCAYFAEHFPDLEAESHLRLVGTCIYHGQMAMRFLPDNERKYAFSVLNRFNKKHPLKRAMYQEMNFKRRIWFDLARLSLTMVCWIRNALGIGF